MIEFYGDSFSADTHGWPSMLATKLSHDLINHSTISSSITETIICLKGKQSFSDIVCITISSPDRIYHPDFLINLSLSSGEPCLIPRKNCRAPVSRYDELKNAIKFYYTYLDNDINRSIRYECEFNWLLNLTNNHVNTKFVLIPCFELTNIAYSEFNGIVITPPLINYYKNKRSDINHISPQQNKKFAEQLYDLLLDYDNNKSKYVNIEL